MTEHAYDHAHRSSEDSPPPPPPAATRCTLCDAPLDDGAERCGDCGLWAGGYGEPVSRTVLIRLGAAFLSLYVVALVVVALARSS